MDTDTDTGHDNSKQMGTHGHDKGHAKYFAYTLGYTISYYSNEHSIRK